MEASSQIKEQPVSNLIVAKAIQETTRLRSSSSSSGQAGLSSWLQSQGFSATNKRSDECRQGDVAILSDGGRVEHMQVLCDNKWISHFVQANFYPNQQSTKLKYVIYERAKDSASHNKNDDDDDKYLLIKSTRLNIPNSNYFYFSLFLKFLRYIIEHRNAWISI